MCACGDDAPHRAPDAVADVEVADADAADGIEDAEAVEIDAPAPLDLAEPVPAGRVVAGVATRPEHLVQGPKAEGRIGDLVLANARARFVVEGVRRAGGYRMWGGTLVDVAVDGVPDHYGEIWLAWNLEAFVPSAASVVSDGADGVAHVRIAGHTARYPWPDSFLRSILHPPPADLDVVYDYRLAPDEARLELTITLTNGGDHAVALELPLMAMNMGDGARSFAPGGGFDRVSTSFDMPWLGAVGAEVSYGVVPEVPLGGVFSYANMDIVSLPAFRIAAGAEHQLDFAFVATTEGTSGIEALIPDSPSSWTISGAVSGAGDGAWVGVTNDTTVAALVPVRDGRYEARITPGAWSVQAFSPGGPSAPITASAGADDADLALPEPAELSVTIRDAASGEPLPAQLTLFREDDTASPFAPPAIRLDRDPGAQRSALIFAAAPGTVATVPAGHYTAVASRGYSYELATVALDLQAGARRAIDLSIERVVDTSGWSAADFHLHAQWSSDSEVPYDTRVRQAAANDVAIPVLTEHAYVGDLLSAAELAGVSDWVAAIPAQEVTTFEYGHFNAFPLVYDPVAPSGGAVFEHGRPGAELFDAMRAQQPGEVLIQVNHPRSATPLFAYFDYIGLDAKAGVPTAHPERFTDNWDLLEVFNGRCLGSERNEKALADWIDLTNLGWKKVLSSGSDSHSEAAGLGHPRSWVKVERTAVALDPEAIVAPLRARATFVSCGPFVRFSAADGTPMGGLTAVDSDGSVSFAVTVEAPSWVAVDEVRLLEDGVVIERYAPPDASAGTDPERPAVRFDGAFSARPERDAWYVVEVVGTGSLSPVEMSDSPYALTNPIEVDQDRDGVWTPPGPIGAAPR